jgi:hypothetical protein
MSKAFNKKIDKFFNASFPSILLLFYRVLRCYSAMRAMRVQKHNKKLFAADGG